MVNIKLNDLVLRESQNTVTDPLDWQTRKQINELYNDARQAEIEIRILRDTVKYLEYWTCASMGLAVSAVIFVLLTWGR